MNNLSPYCGLLDAKIRASDKDLPENSFQNYKDCCQTVQCLEFVGEYAKKEKGIFDAALLHFASRLKALTA